MGSRFLDRWALPLVLLAGLTVRLPFLAVDPHIAVDMGLFIRWGHLAHAGGLPAVYAARDVNYGPLSVLLLAAAAWMDAHLPEDLRHGNGALIALIKLPPVLADVATAGLIAWALRRWLPARPRLATIAALAYVFNPGVWYVSAYWGQLDSVYTLFLVASIVSLADGRVRSSWMAYVVAMTVKTLGVSLAPLLVAWSLAKHGIRASFWGLATAVVVGVALFAPWLISGRVHEVAIRAYLTWPSGAPRIVVSAYNLWYLLRLGRVHNVSSAVPLDGLPVSYQTGAIVVFVVFVAAVIAVAVRRIATPIVPAAALSLGMFMLLTQMHERHMLPALPFVLLAAARGARQPHGGRPRVPALSWPGPRWWDYGVLSLTFFFNLVTIASFVPSVLTNLVAAEAGSPRVEAFKALSVVAAGLNLLVLARLVLALVTPRPPALTGQAPRCYEAAAIDVMPPSAS